MTAIEPNDRASERGSALLRIVLIAVAAAVATVAMYAVLGTRRPPAGPVEVLWDREACAHCHMHVGDPAFAVQLHTAEGEILFFDDPGCYFDYVDRRRPEVHAAYFHALRGDAWLRAPDVAFVSVERSPMGYGFGAVAPGTEGAETLEATRVTILRRLGRAVEEAH